MGQVQWVRTVGGAPLAAARAELDWVSDEDLPGLDSRDATAAGALSLLLAGGGQLYTKDEWKGLALMAVAVTALLVLPMPLGLAIYFVLGASSASVAVSKARKINNYLALKRDSEKSLSPVPAEYRLLAAMNRSVGAPPTAGFLARVPGGTPVPGLPVPVPTASGANGPLCERLHKLHALHRSGVISDAELSERKVDLLAELTNLSRQEMDDLLFDLLPLIQQGALDEQDVDFLKRLGAST